MESRITGLSSIWILRFLISQSPYDILVVCMSEYSIQGVCIFWARNSTPTYSVCCFVHHIGHWNYNLVFWICFLGALRNCLFAFRRKARNNRFFFFFLRDPALLLTLNSEIRGVRPAPQGTLSFGVKKQYCFKRSSRGSNPEPRA